MNMIRRLMTTDIPFARDDAHRMLPAMIACLVGFAALLLAVALSLNHALDTQSRAVMGGLQIEVPANATAGTVEKVTAALRKMPEVEEVALLERGAMEALLKPWLGNDFSVGSLPMPTLLEVKTDGEASRAFITGLEKSLHAIDDDIRVADRGPWVAQLADALGLLQALVVLVAILLLLCVVGMVILVARTNLKLHFKTVGLLHMFGATDDYILKQFQWNGASLAVRGAVVGVALALLVFGAVAMSSMQLHSPILPVIHFTLLHGVAFLVLPIFTAAIALVATRVTVQSMLRQMH